MSKCIFILGSIDKKLIIPLLLSLVYLILNIYEIFEETDDSNIYVNYVGYSFGQMSALIIPYIFKIKKSETGSKKCTKENFKDYFFLILINVIFSAVEMVSIFFGDDDIPRLCIIEGFEIIIIFSMTLLVMKYKYYMHHIISLIIFIILSIIIDGMLKRIQYISIEGILAQIAYTIIESTYYIYIKYLIDVKYRYYWNILFFIGISSLVIDSLTFIILFSIKQSTNDPEILTNLDYYSIDNIGNIIIRFIVEFLFFGVAYNILEMETLNNFSLNHIFVCYEISKIPEIFIHNNNNVFGWLSIIPVILQVIILLFYLEIFEYNFCNLNENTKKNIQKREKADNLDCIKDEKSMQIEMFPGYYIEHDDEDKIEITL